MTKTSRMPLSAIAAMAVPFVLLLGGCSEPVSQQGQQAQATQQARWSDPATWPNGRVPAAGDAVTIGSDMQVLLDITTPALRSLTIEGKLSFANDQDLELTTDWIVLHGELQIGSENQPHTRQATITLTDSVPDEDVMAMGDRGIMIMGGTLNLHGDRSHTWTQLASTAAAGATSIEVLNASGWRVGDTIVLASTDFDFQQAEKRTITSIDGNRITLDRALEYMHFGEITYGVDQRGEVGLLTRNIRIQASDDAEQSYFGGHVMAMPGSSMYVSGVEFYRMGQHLHLARYPIHWHLVGDAEGQYIRNAAIHDTYSRCVTVHGTHNVRVENNVTYNTVGHCFFLEDGIETGNWFVKNLGIQTKCHPTLPCEPTNLVLGSGATAGQSSPHVLLPSDNTVSTYWITNPGNHFVDNVAAGSGQIGFWIALPVNGIGLFEQNEIGKNTWPRRSALGTFRGNVAHSNFDGLMFDRGPRPDNHFNVVGSNYHTARIDPTDPESERIETHIEDFTAYKNRNGGIWARGELHVFSNLKLADNGIGFTHAAGEVGRTAFSSKVIDSLFVGESDNIGNPRTEAEIAYGRSLPLPNGYADFPIRGYEFYDFRHDVVNTTFRNFQDNDTREAGAMSYLLYTSFGISSRNAVEGLTFENAKPVHFPAMDMRWASDTGKAVNYKGAAIYDKDGSLGGGPGSFVVIDNGIGTDNEACEFKASWNAAICQGHFGRVGIRYPAVGGTMTTPPAGSYPPISLIRHDRELTIGGGTGFGSNGGDITIRSGVEVKTVTEHPTLALSLREMDAGSWVVFELPSFKAASSGVALDSLDALRNAGETAYYQGKDALWVKLMVEADQDGAVIPANIEVTR
jgi:cell migration-inducing and hyaluronan-binding protein